MANVAQFPSPRIVRSAPDPLGLYVRLGRNDHTEFLNLLATGDAGCFGTVFDPTYLKRHQELRHQVLAHKLDAILDPRTQAAATPGGFTEALGKLPWGLGRQHVTDDFKGNGGQQLVSALGDFVLEHGFTQVIAPTHLLRSAADEWLEIDVEVTEKLRNYLDKKSGAKVPIVYSLALTGAMLRDAEQRHEVINALRGLPINAVWLKVDGFGSDGSPTAVRNYIQAAAEFHELGIPVIADHVGGLVGLALVSFGATSGLAHGVTYAERFNSANWRKVQDGDKFSLSTPPCSWAIRLQRHSLLSARHSRHASKTITPFSFPTHERNVCAESSPGTHAYTDLFGTESPSRIRSCCHSIEHALAGRNICKEDPRAP